MSHREGAYLGAVCDLETLRGRCVIEAGCDCWHIRTARGKPMPKGQRHVVWVHGRGAISVTRLAWEYSTGKPVRKGYVVTRVCGSYDCVNPGHLRCWTRDQEGEWIRKEGRSKTARKAVANRIHGARRSRFSTELRRWIIESPQSGTEVAHALGTVQSYVNAIRAKARAAHSVWGSA